MTEYTDQEIVKHVRHWLDSGKEIDVEVRWLKRICTLAERCLKITAVSPEEGTIPVPRATLEKWRKAIEPYWFSSNGEDEDNNDGVIDTSHEIDVLLSKPKDSK